MPNPTKDAFLGELRLRFGSISKLPASNSLFDLAGGAVRIYLRYSKQHGKGTTFFGLRKEDLKQIESRPSYIVFLWDKQESPLFVPFGAYEEVIHGMEPASDGQYKAQIFLRDGEAELYLPRVGRFNLEGLSGWEQLDQAIANSGLSVTPELSHSAVQSMISAIGIAKGFDIWVPQNDRCKLDSALVDSNLCRAELPSPLAPIFDVLGEIDVLWIERGANRVSSMFEVEHTTPIYTALLRFNDAHLAIPKDSPSFRIVAEDARRAAFIKQLNRPTFKASGLNQLCTFLEYRNVFGWLNRVSQTKDSAIANSEHS